MNKSVLLISKHLLEKITDVKSHESNDVHAYKAVECRIDRIAFFVNVKLNWLTVQVKPLDEKS